MAEITVFTTDCPRCKILEGKLNSAGILYQRVTDVEEMQKLGIMSAPMMKVGEKLLSFGEAVRYVNNQDRR